MKPARSIKRYCVFRHLPKFDQRAGLLPLVKMLDTQVLEFDFFWEKWEPRSWRISHMLRTLGNRYYNSTWNALAPWADERRFLKQIQPGGSIVHFMWAEFASPKSHQPYHQRGAKVIGTYHCSARRLPSVLAGHDPLSRYDYLTLMSDTQVPFFLERGVPREKMKVILHGVNTEYFCPAENRRSEDRLKLLLVGDTERDHEFASRLFDRLPPDKFEASVKTREPNWHHYDGMKSVRLLPRLDGDELLQAYQQADLLVIPMLDCTANNAVLESMACGTPVVVNRIGGISEYVSDQCNFVFEEKEIDAWVDRLMSIWADRDDLQKRRGDVRTWAEKFNWERLLPRYIEAYDEMLSTSL